MVKLINGNWNAGDYTEFIKKYIEEHYMKEIQLSDLAVVVHVTPSYLSTKFKKEMGISFTEYLVTYRINKAKEVLKGSKVSCKEAAAAVGYSDYAQFSKMFKKYTGVTPYSFQKSSSESGNLR